MGQWSAWLDDKTRPVPDSWKEVVADNLQSKRICTAWENWHSAELTILAKAEKEPVVGSHFEYADNRHSRCFDASSV